jgi:glycosyl transferase family 87
MVGRRSLRSRRMPPVTARQVALDRRSWSLPDRPIDRLSWVVLLAMGIVFGLGWAISRSLPVDALLYWNTDLSHLYGTVWAENAGSFFVYPPPLAQVMVLVRPLGWSAFIAVWTFILFAATAYAGRGWALALVLIGILLFPFVGFDQPLAHPLLYPLIGNLQPLLAALVILGFRYPGTWSVIILTKIGPGVGVLWFAFRREWRSFLIALAWTASIAAVSFVLAPGLWFQFFDFAIRNAGTQSPNAVVPIPFSVRLAMSIALLFWGARTDRRWTVPIAAGWAAIALYNWTFVEFWMAAPVLWAMDRDRKRRPEFRPAPAGD